MVWCYAAVQFLQLVFAIMGFHKCGSLVDDYFRNHYKRNYLKKLGDVLWEIDVPLNHINYYFYYIQQFQLFFATLLQPAKYIPMRHVHFPHALSVFLYPLQI